MTPCTAAVNMGIVVGAVQQFSHDTDVFFHIEALIPVAIFSLDCNLASCISELDLGKVLRRPWCRDVVAGECSIPVPVSVLHPDAQGADACGGVLHWMYLWY